MTPERQAALDYAYEVLETSPPVIAGNRSRYMKAMTNLREQFLFMTTDGREAKWLYELLSARLVRR